jgi:hypothetical protein
MDKTNKAATRIINDQENENKLKDKKFDIFELFSLTT